MNNRKSSPSLKETLAGEAVALITSPGRSGAELAAIEGKKSESETTHRNTSRSPADVGDEGIFDLFEEAIESIPPTEKMACLEAEDRCPHLASTESEVDRFFRLELEKGREGGRNARNAVFAAARRFLKYWEYRKHLFEERAFVPMMMPSRDTSARSSPSALSHTDVSCLNTDFIVRLPNDERGRLVLCCNISSLPLSLSLAPKKPPPSSAAGNSKLRCLFYMLQIASEDPRAQMQGISFIWTSSRSLSESDRREVEVALDLITNVMPVRLEFLHWIYTGAGGNSDIQGRAKVVQEKRIQELHQMLASFLAGNDSFRIHAEDHSEIHLDNFKLYGISERSLPEAIGGTWTLRHHIDWISRRSEFESKVMAQTSGRLHGDADVKMPASTKAAESDNEYKSETSSVDPQHIEVSDVAVSSTGDLSEEGTSNVAERLRALEAEAAKEERHRMKNRLYSRSKRLRRKTHEQNLEAQYSRLRLDNEELKREHRRLKDLVFQAERLESVYHDGRNSELQQPSANYSEVTAEPSDSHVDEVSVTSFGGGALVPRNDPNALTTNSGIPSRSLLSFPVSTARVEEKHLRPQLMSGHQFSASERGLDLPPQDGLLQQSLQHQQRFRNALYSRLDGASSLPGAAPGLDHQMIPFTQVARLQQSLENEQRQRTMALSLMDGARRFENIGNNQILRTELAWYGLQPGQHNLDPAVAPRLGCSQSARSPQALPNERNLLQHARRSSGTNADYLGFLHPPHSSGENHPPLTHFETHPRRPPGGVAMTLPASFAPVERDASDKKEESKTKK